ncbi:MAG: protein jag [Clostridia bacterium]|nr:protein jag [Clostridia bacterium]
MKKEFTVTGKTISEAIATAKAEAEAGIDPSGMQFEIIEQPKKGILGIGSSPAVVKVTYEVPDPDAALDFVKTVVSAMGLDAAVTKTVGEDGSTMISVEGEGTSYLIGHHGETLDSLQYLASLAANRRISKENAADNEGGDANDDGDEKSGRKYTRVTVDIAGYRAKREETLRSLARRTAARVKKSGRSVTLDPMSSYERRIVHSEIQGIDGVTTHSVGTDTERRIVVALDRGGYKRTGGYQRTSEPSAE